MRARIERDPLAGGELARHRQIRRNHIRDCGVAPGRRALREEEDWLSGRRHLDRADRHPL